MKLRTSILALSALLLVAFPSFAQDRNTVELNPFAGYLFGGTFDRGSNALFNTKVDVDNHVTFGGRLGFLVTRAFEVELQYSRTETHFVSHDTGNLFGPDNQRLGDLNIDYYLAYGTWNFGHNPRIKPYITLGAGAARLDPKVPDTVASAETKFTASLGVGIKTMFNKNFGLRFDGRYYTTRLGNGNNRDRRDNRCDFWDNCDNNRDWLTNGDVTGGLVFAF